MTLFFQLLQLQILRCSSPVSMKRQIHAAHVKCIGFESVMIRINYTDSLVLPIFIQDHLALRENIILVILWLTSSLCFTGKILIFNYGRDIPSLLLHALFCQQDKVCKVFSSLNRLIASLFMFADEYRTANRGGNGWGNCLVCFFNPSNPKSWGHQEFPQILPTV